jgi:hypothetical protein
MYEATKHDGVCALYTAGVSRRTIAQMAGWSVSGVDSLLKVYGHADVAAQAEINALYAAEREEVDA